MLYVYCIVFVFVFVIVLYCVVFVLYACMRVCVYACMRARVCVYVCMRIASVPVSSPEILIRRIEVTKKGKRCRDNNSIGYNPEYGFEIQECGRDTKNAAGDSTRRARRRRYGLPSKCHFVARTSSYKRVQLDPMEKTIDMLLSRDERDQRSG